MKLKDRRSGHTEFNWESSVLTAIAWAIFLRIVRTDVRSDQELLILMILLLPLQKKVTLFRFLLTLKNSLSCEGFGVLWNVPKGKSKKKSLLSSKKNVDTRELRTLTVAKAKELDDSDQQLGAYEYLSKAKDGYNSTLPELTLHQVMRKLMRVLKRLLGENCERLESVVDSALLIPAQDTDKGHDFPEELKKYKEYRQFFAAKMKSSDLQKKSFAYQGSSRPLDKLDPLFRIQREGDLDAYSNDPKAGGSMHSKIGWKSVLSTGDALAISDPKVSGVELH